MPIYGGRHSIFEGLADINLIDSVYFEGSPDSNLFVIKGNVFVCKLLVIVVKASVTFKLRDVA